MSSDTTSSNSSDYSLPVQIDVDPACVIERCVLFTTGISLLLALLLVSHIVFALFVNRMAEAGEGMILALAFLAVYGIVKLCFRVLATRLAVIAALIIVLLFYTMLSVG